MTECATCNKSFKSFELRPYGSGGSPICSDCGFKPENRAETERRMHDMISSPGHTVLDAHGIRKASTDEVAQIIDYAINPPAGKPS